MYMCVHIVCVCVATMDIVDTKSPKTACPIAKCRSVRIYITSPEPMKHQKGRRVNSVN